MSRFAGSARTRVRRVAVAVLTVTLAATAPVVLAPGTAAAAPAPVLFSDDFEDLDLAGWRTSGGPWTVVGEQTQVLHQARVDVDARALTGDRAWVDYSVGVRVKPLSYRDRQSSVAVLARVQSDGSHYYLASRADDTVEIGKVVRGRTTTLATAARPAGLLAWRSLTLVVKGTTLMGVVSGTPLLTATDTQFHRGRAGLASHYSSAHFDDVTVQSYAATSPDTQAPLTPAGPKVLSVTPTTATISWTPTIDNVGVTEYWVFQGTQFYEQYPVRFVAGTGPITLTLNPTAASIHFAVAARDAAGNMSAISNRAIIPQPPSFPKSGDDTVAPTAPGDPRITGRTDDGRSVLTWAPATDNVGVVEYHVLLVTNIDEVRLLAKVSEPSAAVSTSAGPNALVQVIAYDAAWNSSRSRYVPYGPGPTPTPAVR